MAAYFVLHSNFEIFILKDFEMVTESELTKLLAKAGQRKIREHSTKPSPNQPAKDDRQNEARRLLVLSP